MALTGDGLVSGSLDEKGEGVSGLDTAALLHHHHHIWVNDRVESVCNSEHSAVSELRADRALDYLVSPHVHIRSRFV